MTKIIHRYPDPFEPEVIAAIKRHAIECFPEESCGFVTEGGYLPCKNTHPEPTKGFRIDPKVTARVLKKGPILAVVHSHPDGPNFPSFPDLEQQLMQGTTWGVLPITGITAQEGHTVPLPHDVLWWGDDLPIPDLFNRVFIWGIFHCWTLYRHWFKLEHDIWLKTFPCGNDFIEAKNNIFVDRCEETGMRNLGKIDMSGLQRGDMLLGHLRGGFPNHCGVYLGGDDFLHHPPLGVSGKTDLLRWWPHIDTVFRYDGPA